MDVDRKRAVVFCTVYGLLLGAGVLAAGLWLSGTLPPSFSATAEEWLNVQAPWALSGFQWGMVQPLSVVALLVFAGTLILTRIIWELADMVVPPSLKNVQEDAPAKKSTGASAEKDFIDQRMEQERKRRLFLHFLGVLQREGRLLDFFDEDLSLYEDEQIGAAVRSIQEDCKKTLERYISPRPVMDREEGDKITIEKGFDMESIVLTGNVAGSPPFEGVVRHPGWKAGKKEVPKLADVQDSGILMPAQVEIL